MGKHYDVVVLGAGLGALSAAALLARRSWRVLVLGQGAKPPLYTHDGLAFARRPFTHLAGASPAFTRVLVELAQSQTFRRRMASHDPMFQVLASGIRLELPPDTSLFAREVEREFPEVKRVVDELYAELARINAAADAAFEQDAVWPPTGFWERRATARLVGTLPHLTGAERDLMAEFPRDHFYRAVVETSARFASDLAEAGLSTFATARLHGAFTRGLYALEGGEVELTAFLVDRIRAHGGEVKLRDRAIELLHKRGRVAGLVVDGDAEATGVQFVVSDLSTQEVLDLAKGFEPSARALAALPRLVPVEERFVVSMVVREQGIPAALAAEAFLVPEPRRDAAPHRPPIHLQKYAGAELPPGHALLVGEALLAEADGIPLRRAREAVLATVEEFLPFVEQHYVAVDSPHDGRPLWDYRSGRRVDVDRTLLRGGGGSVDAEPMLPQWLVEPKTFHGLGGEPLRAPLGNTFVVGRGTLPALGAEGELLAAWGAARLITQTDRKKEKMRREMWTKVEV